MTHPTGKSLALYAGGDVSLLERWRLNRHTRECASCRAEVEQFQSAAKQLQEVTVKLPERLDWDRMAAEMTANIHLGLEAGECVGPTRREAPPVTWRAAAVMAGICMVLGAAWWLNPPSRRVAAVRSAHVEIRTTAAGLELNENGSSLTLLHTRGSRNQRPIIVSAPGTLRARYVDAETGQMTINNVYSE